jgi:hypothetical protein
MRLVGAPDAILVLAVAFGQVHRHHVKPVRRPNSPVVMKVTHVVANFKFVGHSRPALNSSAQGRTRNYPTSRTRSTPLCDANSGRACRSSRPRRELGPCFEDHVEWGLSGAAEAREPG